MKPPSPYPETPLFSNLSQILPILICTCALIPLAIFLHWWTQNLGSFKIPEIPPMKIPIHPLIYKIDQIFVGLGIFTFLFCFRPLRKSLSNINLTDKPKMSLPDFFGIILCCIVLQDICIRIATYCNLKLKWDIFPTLYFVNVLMLASIALIILLMIPLTWKCTFRDFGFKTGKFLLWGPWLAYLLAYPILFGLESLINPEQTVAQPLARYFINGDATIGMKIETCFIIPIVEEILFRGFFLMWVGSLCQKYFGNSTKGAWNAIFWSALFFAIVHGASLILIQVFVLGVILGFLRLYFQSLYPCILFHIFHNSLACIKFEIIAKSLGN